jgi:hypothetical protein
MDIDAECVDTVCMALENDGIMQEMKSQLLGKVYEILLRDANGESKGVSSPMDKSAGSVKRPLKSEHERVLMACVRDVLQSFDMSCTLSVFDNEIKNVRQSCLLCSRGGIYFMIHRGDLIIVFFL